MLRALVTLVFIFAALGFLIFAFTSMNKENLGMVVLAIIGILFPLFFITMAAGFPFLWLSVYLIKDTQSISAILIHASALGLNYLLASGLIFDWLDKREILKLSSSIRKKWIPFTYLIAIPIFHFYFPPIYKELVGHEIGSEIRIVSEEKPYHEDAEWGYRLYLPPGAQLEIAEPRIIIKGVGEINRGMGVALPAKTADETLKQFYEMAQNSCKNIALCKKRLDAAGKLILRPITHGGLEGYTATITDTSNAESIGLYVFGIRGQYWPDAIFLRGFFFENGLEKNSAVRLEKITSQ